VLTGDLVRARVSGKTIHPVRVDPDQRALVEVAEALCEAFQVAATERATRSELEETVDTVVEGRPRPKLTKGLAKLLFDRTQFEVAGQLAPAELRKIVFEHARTVGPLALEPGPFQRPVAQDVFEAVGEALGIAASEVSDTLYADLKQNQRIESFDARDADWLLHRYNVAQVQALLLRALELRVHLTDPTAARMRQLFRQVKFHRLLHRARRVDDTLEVVLDGPTSLFSQSTRYGMALANFFPALLLQPGPWHLEATILWTRGKHRKQLSLDHTCGLRSHYTPRGGYQTREQAWFVERFDALDCGWELNEGKEPIPLGGKGVLFPDFTLERAGQTAHLEILGFWRHDDLTRRIELIERYGPGNVVLAVSRKLRGSKEALATKRDWIVEFAEVVPARKVLDAVQQVAR